MNAIEIATQILAIVGAVMATANGITMMLSNEDREGVAHIIVAVLNILAGNVLKNENTPLL